MRHDLPRTYPLLTIIYQKLLDQVTAGFTDMRYKLVDTGALLGLKVEIHVRGFFLKFGEDLPGRCSQYVVNFVNLVQLVVSWKKREQG